MHKCFATDTCFCQKKHKKHEVTVEKQPKKKAIKHYKNKALTIERNKND